VDGEVVAFSDGQTRFAQLQQRMQQARPSADLIRSVPVQYYLFDVLWADGTDLRPQPLRERKQRLHQLLDFADPLRFTEHRVGDGVEFYSEACHLGWEGLIAKRADAPYQAGRTKDWLKFKCENNQELVIGGFTDPQGTRTGLGALLLGYYDSDGQLVYAGKVGTGFNQQTLHRLHAELSAMEQDRSPFERGDLPRERGVHWARPRLVAQIGFSEWTTDGRLRHPRFQGLRRDKSPAEVIREVPQEDG
jgi:DNA ligase D-like protein (predicted ligase)